MLFAILRGLSKELREFMPAIDPNNGTYIRSLNDFYI
jgi:hypothetical protein